MVIAFSSGLSLAPLSKRVDCTRLVTVRPRRFHTPAKSARPYFRQIFLHATASSSPPSPQTVPTASPTAGLVRVTPSQNIAVGDTLVIEYSPPPNLFRQSDGRESEASPSVFWAGGFRGWTGSEADAEDTLMFPMLQLPESASSEFAFHVSVAVPDYATDVQFGFCDASGISWDLNDGNLFRVPVKYQKREGADGKVIEFVAGEESSGDSGEDGAAAAPQEAFDADLARESASAPVISAEAEETLHRVRGEATFAGEEAGLGSVFISQVRDVFSRYDVEGRGSIAVAKVGEVLAELNFDLGVDRVQELVDKYVGKIDREQDTCGMTEFMLMYCELELADEGLEIV